MANNNEIDDWKDVPAKEVDDWQDVAPTPPVKPAKEDDPSLLTSTKNAVGNYLRHLSLPRSLKDAGGRLANDGLIRAAPKDPELNDDGTIKDLQGEATKRSGNSAAPYPMFSGAGAGKLAARVASGTALGGVDAGLHTPGKTFDPDAALQGAKWSALAGMLGESVGAGLGALAEPAKDVADARTIKALGPTLSQQEVLNNKGVASELAQGLRDEGVVGFGNSAKNIAPKLEEYLGEKGARIGDIRQEVSDAMGNSVDMSRLAKKGDALNAFTDASDTATQNMAKSYGDNANNFAKVPQRSVQETQDLVQSLNSQIPFNKSLADMTPEQQALKTLRGDLVGQVDDSVRQYSPALSDEYSNLKDQFGLFKNAEPMVDKAAARQMRNGDLGLKDLMVGQLARKTASSPEQALLAAASAIVRGRGDSAAAVTFGAMSKLLASAPEALGAFAVPLQRAEARGPDALAATHQALMQNPEYVKKMNGGVP